MLYAGNMNIELNTTNCILKCVLIDLATDVNLLNIKDFSSNYASPIHAHPTKFNTRLSLMSCYLNLVSFAYQSN